MYGATLYIYTCTEIITKVENHMFAKENGLPSNIFHFHDDPRECIVSLCNCSAHAQFCVVSSTQKNPSPTVWVCSVRESTSPPIIVGSTWEDCIFAGFKIEVSVDGANVT